MTPREQARIQLSNVLARSIVDEILHHSLLTEAFTCSSSRTSSEVFLRSDSPSPASSPTIVSSASTDSFFDRLDPDLPSNDVISRKKPKKQLREHDYRRGGELWLDLEDPPAETKKLIKEINKDDLVRITARRNAVVNQLQKAVTFTKVELIKWPQAKLFTVENGRAKIMEMIEKTWNYSPLLTYTVYYSSATGYLSSLRHRYVARWQSPSGRFAHVYFNMDVPRQDSERPVTVTYTFEDGKIVHKPHTSNYHNRWLRQLIS